MLGVYLGNDFLCAKPDNPTGYWEDRNIYEINERLLAVLGLKWEDLGLIDDARWHEPEVGVAGRGYRIPSIAIPELPPLGIQRSAHNSAIAILAISTPPSRRGRELSGGDPKSSQRGKFATSSSGYEWGNSALTLAGIHGSKSG